MEHRYGKRIPAKMMSVVIDYRKCNFCSPGKISDVSYSGVLVRTNTPLPLFALVQLRLVTRADNVLRLHNLDAHVVRYTQDSVAFA
ncbi:MAG: hypothetical protein OEW08_14445 [Gammaproteobacteria bacterium]|nr:hypothetical protein [Gammaproteobacteria bacterium]